MRKSVLLLASMVLALVLVGGVALAATLRGTDGNDVEREGFASVSPPVFASEAQRIA